MNYKLKVLSVIGPPQLADEPRTVAVRKILEHHGYDHYQRVDPLWMGWMSKVIAQATMLTEVDESYTHVAMLDARDVVVLGTAEEVMRKWFEFGHPWVFNAEPHIWSPESFTPEEYPTPDCTYRYLNSGVCLGEREHMLRWYREWTNDFNKFPTCPRGDQDWYAGNFIKHYPEAIQLDHNCKLFQCMCGSDWLVDVVPGHMHNRQTDTDPLVIHFNGGTDITAPDRAYLWDHWL